MYWIDPNGRTADQPQAGQEYLPLIVFYVPDGYVSDGLLELTPYLSDVFRKAGGVLSVADHELGVTYITAYVKDSDDPEPSVSKNKSAGETDGRTGDLAEDTEPKDSFGTDGSETPENAPSSDEPEQSDQSGTADDPKGPETDQPDDPKEPEDDPPIDEPEEPDPYIVFAEKYREDEYMDIPWDEELEAFGGLDQIDLVRLVKTCVYAASSHYIRSNLRENKEEPYTASGLYNLSQSRRITMDSTDGKYYWDDLYNSYIFGPLAVMYMGELYNRKTTGNSTVLTDADSSISVDTIAVRNGIPAIMERMHNGETMDSVIVDISDGKYSDTQDLCKKYFDMDGPNMDSMGFAANVLNYVDALSKENGAPIPASILIPFDENILDLIDLTKPASTDIYVIQEGTGFVKSTVPDEIAFRTGTKSDPAEVLGIREEQDSNAALNGSGKDTAPAASADEDAGSDTYEDLAVPPASHSAQDGEAA